MAFIEYSVNNSGVWKGNRCERYFLQKFRNGGCVYDDLLRKSMGSPATAKNDGIWSKLGHFRFVEKSR